MNKKPLIIGIAAVARAGKDTACEILVKLFEKEGLKAKRIALADELKLQIRPTLLEKYQIDVLNCTPSEKEEIRPDLVAFGKEKRAESKGTFWTNIVSQKLKTPEFSEYDIIIVPDIRYHFYPEDEATWVRKQGGILLYLSRYDVDADGNKTFIPPANEDEATYDPILFSISDVQLFWKTGEKEALYDAYKAFFDAMVTYAKVELQQLNG